MKYTFSLGLDTDVHNEILNFPTVTICPVNSEDQGKVNETVHKVFAEKIDFDGNYSDLISFYAVLPNLTYDNIDIAYKLFLASKMDSNVEKSFNKSTLREMVFKLAMKCEDLFSVCTYRGESVPCCNFFEQLYSEQGFCFSFNPRYIGLPDQE
jgi:acid-sensing ion channel, other